MDAKHTPVETLIRIDRANGRESECASEGTREFGAWLKRLADNQCMTTYNVLCALREGVEFATTGFVYRLEVK